MLSKEAELCLRTEKQSAPYHWKLTIVSLNLYNFLQHFGLGELVINAVPEMDLGLSTYPLQTANGIPSRI